MSVKSRRKREQQNSNKPSPDILTLQKQTMKKAFLDYLGAAIMCLVMALVTFIVGLCTDDASHSKGIIFVATPIILGITFICVFLFLHRFVIYSKFNKIKCSKVQTVKIVCKKVAFLTQPISRHSFVIICIVLTDEKGEKYYDVTNGISDHAEKGTRNELINSEVTLVCYANTHCIKFYQTVASKEQN